MPRIIAKTSALVVLVLGALILVTWGPIASQIRGGWTELFKMSAGTALLFVLMGLDLWLLTGSGTRNENPQQQRFWNTPLLAILTVAIAALRFFGYIFHRSFGIDHLWFHPVSPVAVSSRMAAPTACVFVLLGTGSVLRRSRWARFFEAPVMLGGLIAWLGMLHYLLGGNPVFSYTEMSVQATLAFLILTVGILTACPDIGLVALMSSNTSGGLLARRLVPCALFLPTAFGVLRLEAQRAGWIGTEAGVSLFAIANLVTFGGLIWSNAASLDRSDQSLRASEERFAKAFRSNPLPISISTPENGRYIDVNDAFLEMLGYVRSEVVGHTASELNLWVNSEQRSRVVEQAASVGRATGIQTQVFTKKGAIRDIELAMEVIELNESLCMLTINRDITDEKCLQQQFQQAQKMEAVGRLAAGVAHDFNNMLAVIMGYADLAREQLPPSDPIAGKLREIKNAAERAAALTRQLLTFSRQQLIYPQVLDLNGILPNIVQMLPRVLGEDVSIKLQHEMTLGSIKADLSQIEQVLMNLAVNARDAMPQGGELTIATANAELDESYASTHPGVQPGPYVMLSVSDNGSGMSAETKARIFEPFFTTKGPGLGTGLGLSTVHGIVQQNGGHIWVYSEPNKGTIFKIYFPRVDQAAEMIRRVPAVKPSRGSETILLVEDDEALRNLLAELLADAGYRILDSPTPEAAVEMANSFDGKIHMLLTDVIMPGMGGAEVAEHISEHRPDIKVLYMSGYRGDLVAKAKGTILLLEKPFTKRSLLATVRGILDGDVAVDVNPLD